MRRLFHTILISLAVVWASPWSAVGCSLGLLSQLCGGSCQLHGRVLEFEGKLLAWLLSRAPLIGGAAAMTLGHTVIARSQADLDRTRDHEFVHVQQYERWGPFFVPAYFLSSGWAWLCGKDPYWDNPFEREAYERAP